MSEKALFVDDLAVANWDDTQSILNTSSELINASVLVDNTTLLNALGVLRSCYKYCLYAEHVYRIADCKLMLKNARNRKNERPGKS